MILLNLVVNFELVNWEMECVYLLYFRRDYFSSVHL